MRTVPAVAAAFLTLAACGGGGGDGASSGPAPTPDAEPIAARARTARTVLVIVLDAPVRDHLPTYGYALDTTPHLAALARESVVFEDHITPCTGANAGLASLLTGLYAQEHGVGSLRHRGLHRLGSSRTTLAELFHDAGWATLAVVSLPQLRADVSGLDQGFDVFLAPSLGEGERRTADQSYYNARGELRRALAAQRPLFALLHFADTGAREAPEGPDGTRFLRAHMEPFRERRPLVGQALDRLAEDPQGALANLRSTLTRGRGSEEHTALLRAAHDGRLHFVDRHLGELLDLLRQAGRYEDALIVVTATRGSVLDPPPVGAPAFHPALVTTPLFLRLPGALVTGRVEALAQTVDLAPTLAEIFAWPQATPFSGISLLPAIAGLRDRNGPPGPAGQSVPDGPDELGRIAFCEAASLEWHSAFDPRYEVEENRVGGVLAYRRDGTRVAREAELPLEDRRRLANLRRALADFRRPAEVLVESGGGGALEVRWRFEMGFAGPARLEDRGGAPLAGAPAPRVSGLTGKASLPPGGGRLRIEASRRELPMRLELDLGGDGQVDEERVLVGDQPLSTCMLPRLPEERAPEWPTAPDGTLEPCDASLELQGSQWWKLLVGRERGPAGRGVEVFVTLFPSGRLDEELEWDAGVEVEARPVPGRQDALFFRGVTPFELQLSKIPSRAFALAIAVEGRVLPGAVIRNRRRCFSDPGELSLYLPDWVVGVTEALDGDWGEPLPPGTLRIMRRGPSLPPEDRAGLDSSALKFIQHLRGGE